MSIPYPDSLSFSAIRRKEKDRHYIFSLLDIYIYFIILATVLYNLLYYISQPGGDFQFHYVAYIMWSLEDNFLYVALRAHLVLMLGVGLPAQLILAVGPFAHVVALVEHSGSLAVPGLHAALGVIPAAPLLVVECADVGLCGLPVERGHALSVARRAVLALFSAAPAADETAPAAAAPPAAAALVLLVFALMGTFSFSPLVLAAL